MEMILLDWTRMGKSYCLAGAILETNAVQIVRPLWVKHRNAGVRKVGWSAFLMDGHQRWDLFKLVGAEPALSEPPHVEDFWVRGMKPLHRQATLAQRRMILEATRPPSGEPLFGQPLQSTQACAFLPAHCGRRSLTTLHVPGNKLVFGGSWRGGNEPDVRVRMPLPGLGEKYLAVKDHHLLRKAAAIGPDVKHQLSYLNDQIHAMGETIAVRLGLSRPFQHQDATIEPVCWVMADGFFSLTDPQP